MNGQNPTMGLYPAPTAHRIGLRLSYALAAGIIFCSAGLLCFVAYDDLRLIARVFNSDVLLPASFFWNLWHGPDAWRFQLPRIPSIFPNLFVYGTLDAVLGDFRATIFGYSVFQCLAFVGAGSLVIRQVTGTHWMHAAALLLVLTEAVIIVDLRSVPIIAHFEMFLTVGHFCAFLMSLVALALVISLLESWRRSLAVLLTTSCFLAYLSNRIFMFDFVLPLGAALLVLLWSGRVSWSRATALAWRTTIGVVAAAGADLLLFREPLLQIESPLSHAMIFFAETPDYLHAAWLPATVSLGVPYLIFACFPLMKSSSSAVPGAGRNQAAGTALLFAWSFASVACVGSVALGAILYIDVLSYRYLTAALFWPLIFVAIAALQVGGRLVIGIAWCALLALGATFLVHARDRNFIPGTATWQDALATCLLQQKDQLGLKAGLAEYWLGRPATIGTNWTMQIDPIISEGIPFVWGNNPRSYLKSNQNPAQAPDYNFIVVDNLDLAKLAQKFGPPARSAPCGPYTLWVYAEPLWPILLNQRR
jgi:hypothetical protein